MHQTLDTWIRMLYVGLGSQKSLHMRNSKISTRQAHVEIARREGNGTLSKLSLFIFPLLDGPCLGFEQICALCVAFIVEGSFCPESWRTKRVGKTLLHGL